MTKRVFIVWHHYHRRSELLAQHLGASIHYIAHGRVGQVWMTPIRYIVQTWRTWLILRQERPDVILVQNPPIFAVVVAALYSRIYGARYVIDSHTGAFLSPKWKWSRKLHRGLSRKALLTIVHNKSQENIVKNWECPYLVVAFTPGEYPPGENYPLSGKFNIAVICSFSGDEPLKILFEAARQLPDVYFYLTGDARRLDQSLLKNKPRNIVLTGYLSYECYIGLLRGVGAVMDLVDNEHTLLMGAFEAVSLGVPLMVSDWPLLRDYFCRGTVYVTNSHEGVCEGVRQMQHNHTELRQEMLFLQEQLGTEWSYKLLELQQLLARTQ